MEKSAQLQHLTAHPLSGAVGLGSKRQTPVDGCCFIFLRTSGGMEKCAALLEGLSKETFSFSCCATSYWEEDGGNYQRQQLRGRQASAHQSALLHRHSVWAWAVVWKGTPQWWLSSQHPGQSEHHQNRNLLKGLKSEWRSLSPLQINFQHLIAAFITRDNNVKKKPLSWFNFHGWMWNESEKEAKRCVRCLSLGSCWTVKQRQFRLMWNEEERRG